MYINQRFNVLSKEECQYILNQRIKYSEVNGVLKDFIVFQKEADAIWKPIIDNLKMKTQKLVDDYLFQFLNLFPKTHMDISHLGFLNDKFGAFTEIHYDWELVILKDNIISKPFVIILYLNEGFEGGELVFPIQNVHTKPEIGSAVIFPCHFAFPHVSTPITSGSKHLCRITFTVSPENYKVEELEI